MTSADARKRMQDHIDAMHARFEIAMTGVWPYPPTPGDPMTTTDARKRNRDVADVHETARARDAAWMLAALNGGSPRTRTHSINPETGEFTPLDFHREWLHVMDTQHPHTPQENDMPNNQRRHREQMGVLDQIKDLLTEILDRLPEREVACGDVWRDETERPCTRPSGHDGNHVDKVGTIWANPEPAPADVDPDEALIDQMVDVIFGDGALSHEGLIEARREIAANAFCVARERIEAEPDDALVDSSQQVRAEKAEADLARVTKERDRLTHLLGSHADGHRCSCTEIDPGKPGIEPPAWEQDPWCLTHPDMAVIAAEVKTLKAKADRYDALREDVRVNRWTPFGILARDDERAES